MQILDRRALFAPVKPRKQRPDSRITRLVIHHDAGANPPSHPQQVEKRLLSYYKQHGGLFPYHFAIDPAGVVYKCNAVSSVLPHAKGANRDGVGIMLMGYFHPPHNEVPTAAQIESLHLLVIELWKQLPGRAVVGHRQVQGSATACPGDGGMAALRVAGILT